MARQCTGGSESQDSRTVNYRQYIAECVVAIRDKLSGVVAAGEYGTICRLFGAQTHNPPQEHGTTDRITALNYALLTVFIGAEGRRRVF